MNVLLVDDQIRVLSGLISGLDWDTLGVTSIRTASSAAQAKSIFLETQVDILLCDIEMPGENGLSLLRWARNRGMECICVFLTSHADFLYAKEAIQLGCFDYILQPARYDEIQSTIARAIARVKDTSADKELRDYGVMAKKQEAALFQNLFSDWSAGRSLSISALRGALHQLGQEVLPDCQCLVIWGHLLRWHAEPWPTQDEALRYLDSLAKEGELDQRALRNFWIQFQQMAFSAIKSLQLESPQLAAAAEQGDRAASLQEIQGAVKALVSCFPKKETVSGNEKSLVEQVRKYVADNLDQNLNVNGVAAALFMNGDYISRVFKNETGTPLKEYIIQREMESARLLLTTTQLPVSVIASKLGYDNFSYFSQAYRRCMGVSPSEERKRK